VTLRPLLIKNKATHRTQHNNHAGLIELCTTTTRYTGHYTTTTLNTQNSAQQLR